MSTDEGNYTNSLIATVLYRSLLAVRRMSKNDRISKNCLTLQADSGEAGYVFVRRDDTESSWQVVGIVDLASVFYSVRRPL